MEYTIEDYNYIKNLLNICVKVKAIDAYYYITSKNIQRQLKYNELYKTKRQINIDLNNITINDNIKLIINENEFLININIESLKHIHNNKYLNNLKINKYISNIICDLLKYPKNTRTLYQITKHPLNKKLCDIDDFKTPLIIEYCKIN